MIHDLKFAVHQLLTNPGFTAVAVFTLAPGICAEPFDVGFEIGGCERGLVPDAQPGGNGVKALWGVDDIQEELQRLSSVGVSVIGGVQDVGGGIKVAEISDPFGNVVGLLQSPS